MRGNGEAESKIATRFALGLRKQVLGEPGLWPFTLP